MSPEQIADVVMTQYSLSEKGSGQTFTRLAILLTDLLPGIGIDGYLICARAFPQEHAAWEGFDGPHAGRLGVTFAPELN